MDLQGQSVRLVVVLALASAACNSSGLQSGSSREPADASVTPDLRITRDLAGADLIGACLPTRTPGASIALPCVTQYDLHQSGGYLPPPPVGSTCDPSGAFTLVVASRQLSWSLCTSNMGAPYTLDSGQRTLGGAEVDGLLTAFAEVTVDAASPPCGADKGGLSITTTTSDGEQTYLDDFYACLGLGIYVAGIDGAFAAAWGLAHR